MSAERVPRRVGRAVWWRRWQRRARWQVLATVPLHRAEYVHGKQVLLAVVQDQPAGLSEAADRRRRLAQRLWAELAYPPYGRPGLGNDFVAATAMPTRLDDAPGVREALAEATVIVGTRPDEVADAREAGARGMWMRVHGPTASVVFSFLPPGASVFVCVDDLPGHCWQVSGVDDESRQLIDGLYDAVVQGWNRQRSASAG